MTDQMDDSQDGTDRNKLVEELFLNHITFNAYEATTLTFGSAGSGLFLAPNADVYVNSSSCGWISTQKTVYGSGGEWHFYNHHRTYHAY